MSIAAQAAAWAFASAASTGYLSVFAGSSTGSTAPPDAEPHIPDPQESEADAPQPQGTQEGAETLVSSDSTADGLSRSASSTLSSDGKSPEVAAEEDDDEDDEEEETCGFCLFMKGGPCKKEFVAWSKCVDREREVHGDFTEECKGQTLALQACMEANPEYYGPMLEAEKEYAENSDKEGQAAALSVEESEEIKQEVAAPSTQGDTKDVKALHQEP